MLFDLTVSPLLALGLSHGLRTRPEKYCALSFPAAGKDLSMLESLVCVGRVLQAFALALPPDHTEVGTVSQFTVEPDCDVCISFNPRE